MVLTLQLHQGPPRGLVTHRPSAPAPGFLNQKVWGGGGARFFIFSRFPGDAAAVAFGDHTLNHRVPGPVGSCLFRTSSRELQHQGDQVCSTPSSQDRPVFLHLSSSRRKEGTLSKT